MNSLPFISGCDSHPSHDYPPPRADCKTSLSSTTMSETFVAFNAGDLESQKVHAHVALEWHDIQHKIGDKAILSGVSGRVESGEMLAVMGPSGAGKSTLLDILSKRIEPTHGTITVDGNEDFSMRSLGAYVEQSDALLGVLSVRETINFAARLSLDPLESQHEIRERVETTISELGLMDVANNRIGNAVQRGISGGQKRRVTIGSALVTKPRILLLDEPTSGLDSRTSREVMAAIKSVAERHKMIVVASIHQPNWETFALFDKLLLLAQGRTMYFGPIMSLTKYLTEGLNHAVPIHANPADIALDLINTDFIAEPAERHIDSLATKWDEYAQIHSDEHRVSFSEKDSDRSSQSMNGIQWSRKSQDRTQNALRLVASRTWILMERNTLNYSRNLLAYGVRLGMYLGMGILLATVWVNLAQTSAKVNDRLSVHFFSVAFLGFMSVAGIPAFLEERQVFVRERMNGLYGPGAYVLANSIVTLPYLFLCVVLFSVICYWSIGLNPGADQFFRFLAILYLAVYAAESQSTVVAAIFPVFVAALAIAAFLNGFWMCVGGYFIRAVNLPRFWYYWAHFIDYQTYAFDLLVRNDFRGITLACTTLDDGSCFCDYPSSLISSGQCALAGDDVLKALGIDGISFKLYAVILLLITLLYRFLFYLVLVFKKR